MRFMLTGLLVAVATPVISVNASPIVFLDSFTVSTAPQTDINFEQATRQSGTILSTMTKPISDTGNRSTTITKRVSGFGSDGVLTFNGNPANVSQTSVDLAANFAPAIAGKLYEISLQALFTSGTANAINFAANNFVGITLRDTPAAQTGFNAQFDVVFAIRPNGDWVFYDDSAAPVQSGSLGALNLYNNTDPFGMKLVIDETGGTPTAKPIYISPAGVETVLGTFNIDFEDATVRRLQVFGSETSNQLAHLTFVDNLTIAIPEPGVASILMAMGATGLLARRRRA